MIHLSSYHGRYFYYDIESDGIWRYVNDDVVVDKNNPLPCPNCGRKIDPNDPVDPCLGRIPGVQHACCGHGIEDMYFVYENGAISRNDGRRWWAQCSFPGMNAILSEENEVRFYWRKRDTGFDIPKYLILRENDTHGRQVFIDLEPIASIPWRTTIPRLAYPQGEDNLTKLQNVINAQFNATSETDKIYLMTREDACLASSLFTRFLHTIKKDDDNRVIALDTFHKLSHSWIYDTQFFMPDDGRSEYRLRTQLPIAFRGHKFRVHVPQESRNVYAVIHGKFLEFDKIENYLHGLRENLPFELV